jgi:hypothetical protein
MPIDNCSREAVAARSRRWMLVCAGASALLLCGFLGRTFDDPHGRTLELVAAILIASGVVLIVLGATIHQVRRKRDPRDRV